MVEGKDEAARLLEEDRRQRAEQAAALINKVLQQLDCVQVPVLVMTGNRITEHGIRIVPRG